MADSNTNPKVSVVVPVYNGCRTISETVRHVLGQSLPPHEVIVVDDGSTDGTLAVLRGFGEKIIVLTQPNGGPASARNYGIRVATSEFVAMTDSDCLPAPDWLSNILKGFDSPRVAGVGGTVKGVDKNLISVYVDIIHLLDPVQSAEGEVRDLVTANACFRRDALLEAGLFDERFRKPGCEDTELSWKLRNLGYQLKTVADAVVLHYHKQTLRIFWKTICNYGEGTYLLGEIRPEYKWKGDTRKGLLASLLGARLLTGPRKNYRPVHSYPRAMAFFAMDYLMSVAFSWGYLKAQRKSSNQK